MSIVCDSDIVLYFSLKVCILWINNNLLRKQQGLPSFRRKTKLEIWSHSGNKRKEYFVNWCFRGDFPVKLLFFKHTYNTFLIHTQHHKTFLELNRLPFLNFTTSLSNLSIFLWNIEIGDFPWKCRGTNQIRLTSTHWVEKLGFSNFC